MADALQRIVDFANRDLSDERTAVEAFVRVLFAFGLPPFTYGDTPPHRQAREFQLDLQLLLRYVARDATPEDAERASALLEAHKNCGEVYDEVVPDLAPARRKSPDKKGSIAEFFAAMEDYQRKVGEQVESYNEWVEGRRRAGYDVTGRKNPPTYKTKTERRPRYPHGALDAVCDLLRGKLESFVRREPPVRVCDLASCPRFLLRRGRQKFCSQQHRWEFDRMPPKQRREYQRDRQFIWRAKRLDREGIKSWEAKLKRRKMDAARRRRLLRILREVLRSR